jgi:hypothetical protein
MLIGTHSERLAAIRGRIAAAAARAGRDPAAIVLIAVSKGHAAGAIEAVHALGVAHFGESYVQEGLEKMDALEARGLPPRPCWHFIGRLQSNKTRAVAERFDWVAGVDRVQIARRLDAQRPAHAPPLNVCLQVRLGDEVTKAGVNVAELPVLAAEVAGLRRLRLRGLMCLPPPSTDTTAQRGWFRQLRQLLEGLNRQGYALDTLSMGMSGDFETAIEEGATQVRIGTGLFGERRY